MSTAVALPSSPLSAPAAIGKAKHFAEYDFTFHDLVSIINPLQHLPVVSTIYRSLTGDTIKPFERIAGDTLYGGVWGCASAVANVVYQEVTGKDFGQQVLDFVTSIADDAQTATGTPSEVSSSTDNSAPATATAASLNTNMGPMTLMPLSLPSLSTVPTSSAPADSSTPAAAMTASLNPNMGAMTLMPLSLPSLSVAPIDSTSSKSPTTTADGPPRGLQMPQVSPSTTDSATLALMNALSNKGIDPTLSQRAVSAYKKSLQAQPSDQTPKTPVPTS